MNFICDDELFYVEYTNVPLTISTIHVIDHKANIYFVMSNHRHEAQLAVRAGQRQGHMFESCRLKDFLKNILKICFLQIIRVRSIRVISPVNVYYLSCLSFIMTVAN